MGCWLTKKLECIDFYDVECLRGVLIQDCNTATFTTIINCRIIQTKISEKMMKIALRWRIAKAGKCTILAQSSMLACRAI